MKKGILTKKIAKGEASSFLTITKNILEMKYGNRQNYYPPQAETLELNLERIICQSGLTGVPTVDDPFGGTGDDLVW